MIKSYIKKIQDQFLARKLLLTEIKGYRQPSLSDWGYHYQADSNQLAIGPHLVADISRLYGSPLYILNSDILSSNYFSFINLFRKYYPNTFIYYSYKTNPLPFSLNLLHRLGAGAEVISHFELWLALKLKVPPERIIFNGPAKTIEALNLALSSRIKLINIDGPTELQILESLLSNRNYCQNVGVRVITSIGWSSQFGFSISDGSALKAFEALSKIPNANPSGIHLHIGTGIQDIESYTKAIQEVFDFCVHLKNSLGIRISYFDLGGGFGVHTSSPYAYNEKETLIKGRTSFHQRFSTLSPSISEFAEHISKVIYKYRDSLLASSPEIIFEPGRAVTSSSMSLLLRVVAKKPTSSGKTIVMLNAGRNIAMPTDWQKHHLYHTSPPAFKPLFRYEVYGPLCHPYDLLYPSIDLPFLSLGNYVLMMDAGAYFLPNQTNFSYPRPGVVVANGSSLIQTRTNETFEDMVSKDTFE